MPFPIIVLAAVFLLVAIRQVGSIRVQIWHAMLGGAVAVIISGDIAPAHVLEAIDPDVMLFLFGIFIVGAGLEMSGYLAHVSYRYFKRARTRDALLVMVLFGSGLASALLMNDTLAIIGGPVVLLLARKHAMSPKLLLLALAIGVTTGSVFSPIGNPQNLLIALNGMFPSPFLTFVVYLFVPTVLSLLLAFIMLRRIFPNDFHEAELKHSQEPIHDHGLAVLTKVSLVILICAILLKVILSLYGVGQNFRLTYIALASALPIIVAGKRRAEVVRRVDWSTLVFFAAMFVLMKSVWETGVFQQLIVREDGAANSTGVILMVGVLLSQLVSNVPLVALYQPVLLEAGASQAAFMALAAGSTIAGNLFILGAASNVIIIQVAERKGKETLTFLEFARVGVPLTVMQVAVFWVYLWAVG